jgi:SAM-dependent methyltransferase
MDEPHFDFDAVFDQDYLYFYEPSLADRVEHDVDIVWRLLELAQDAEVADVPCGHGRIANALAARGCRVTGLDASELFLDVARRDASELFLDVARRDAIDRRVEVEYVRGDMRSLPWRERFDAVVNWFTSFGYFDDSGNRAVLASAYDSLKTGGRFLVDVHNRDAFMRRFFPESFVDRDDDFMLDRRTFDVGSGRVETERIVIRDAAVRRMHFSLRMFTFTELRDSLREAGFAEVHGYDWETGDPLAVESRRMVIVARK